ncbi:XrtA-associated ATPase [Glaciimonas sp. CA11.2]|uniref:XrtA/PEP-CTERM system-associated ATPase n=2 Tax=Glaciimonas sp. CA11.2 TaxID=3048601 RepID=UPI002AB3C3C2|nr:XrtA/PEP-CTERM system-associated ATPase [Glaciimonas sp. CA11.2]MDY7544689.1 XrtA-associated ATPase [Glaciimonas sp. CA11.2]
MYETYYGLRDKPFRLVPDPAFFFASKGHKRALSYLEYGISQGEGFIVITGEVGAGKTTLVRNLFKKFESTKIVAAHLANTHLDPDNILKVVAGAFGMSCEGGSKATLLMELEKFLQQSHLNGLQALLVVDEAQNLTPKTLEELRMLSNFQVGDKSLLQTFLLGQPEFRKTLHSQGMEQLRQRVIATYHLGPMDVEETQAYIEHRLRTVGWQGEPSFSKEAFFEIFAYSGGIPRKINTLCDRLFLMGYLEELQAFGTSEVKEVIRDIEQEFSLPVEASDIEAGTTLVATESVNPTDGLQDMYEKLYKLEQTMLTLLTALNSINFPSPIENIPVENNQ